MPCASIAATHRDLAAAVRQGRLREDLHYRLKVFPVIMPPLCDRLEDIPALVEHLAARLRRRTGKTIAGLTPAALRRPMDYRWPGNVRELGNVMEYGSITCQANRIDIADLPQELREPESHAAAAPTTAPARPTPTASERATLRTAEGLRAALTACGWSKAETARRLGVSPTAVWKWMRRHGLPLKPPTAPGRESCDAIRLIRAFCDTASVVLWRSATLRRPPRPHANSRKHRPVGRFGPAAAVLAHRLLMGRPTDPVVVRRQRQHDGARLAAP